MVYRLMIRVGLPFDQVAALQWPDVDFESGTLLLHRYLYHRGSLVFVGELAAARLVKIPSALVEELRAHRDRLVTVGRKRDFVTVGERAQNLNYNEVNRDFKRAAALIGKPGAALADLPSKPLDRLGRPVSLEGETTVEPVKSANAPARPKEKRRLFMEPLTPEQIVKLLKAATASEYFPYYAVIATTGIPMTRLVSLRWADVDFEKRRMTVRGTITYDGGGGSWREAPGKPQTVPLTHFAVKALRTQRARLLDRGYDGHYVFVSRFDTPYITSSLVYDDLYAIHCEAGFPHLRMWGISKGGANWLHALGVEKDSSPKEIDRALTVMDAYLKIKLTGRK